MKYVLMVSDKNSVDMSSNMFKYIIDMYVTMKGGARIRLRSEPM